MSTVPIRYEKKHPSEMDTPAINEAKNNAIREILVL